ncbi:eukaryotic porin [Plasmopara halstedii]|uniref:Eukaryotic porin n=1 Tax=Plasmopara halstedii TaxID=4781 RepID=A0A0P1A776_PLAHL|nr:eukaryotic porin [Plasmopara halstedii]CEG36516.1 eukaryotic porin [Plasmopara halstedii]|eukprot:XP_024572885.1 eukaryotic porin [Plasmopara halstedii]
MAGRRATAGLSSSLYADFLANNTRLNEPLEPTTRSCHSLEINTLTPSGTAIGLQTCVLASFFKAAVKRNVESALVCESHFNSILTSSLRVSSSRHLALQAHLQASKSLRFTLEAQESATERAPASFAHIGADYKAQNFFAGAKIDAVNGPTLQATVGGKMGDFALGVVGAYDVGLDHSDRLGRFTTLNVATSYTHEDLLALLQINETGRMVQLDLTHTLSGALMASSRFVLDQKTDRRSLRLLGKYAISETEAVASSIGSDGILIGTYEWRTSKHLKTRVTAQMDLRNYDSDSHHLGVSIEIS